MRRAISSGVLLATLLAAPALASAQTAGQIILGNGRTFPNFINGPECNGGGTIEVKWNVTPLNGVTSVPTGATYQLYSSNQDPANNAPANTTCFTANNTSTGLIAFAVGGTATAIGFVQSETVTFTSLITNTANAVAVCNSTADQTFYLCVQGKDGFGNLFGFARASIVVSTLKPPPPVITGVTPGDGALNLTWDPGESTTDLGDTLEYVLEATAIDTTAAADPVGTHQTSRLSGTKVRFGGLVNSVTYSVQAFAFSKADNMSSGSVPVTGTPQAVNDFWETYKAAGGRESGGCASGLAGPLGLGILVATLALVRRRK